MSGFEEEPYSIIFASLKHPVRRKILRMLSEKPRNFSELLEALGISSSHLTYHLENLGELVSKTADGKYKLSAFGEAAVTTMSKVEEVPKIASSKYSPSLPIKWKSFLVVLMIGLVILAGVSYIQYQSLNRVSAEYEKLKELVELAETEGVSLQSKYTLRVEVDKADLQSEIHGNPFCSIYSPYDNFTLDLVLSINNSETRVNVPVSVQEGNVFDRGTSETGPVIWSAKSLENNTYSVLLPSKGWYTISLVGPITKSGYNAMLVKMPITEDVYCWMSLRIIYEGKYSAFVVIPTIF